MKRDPVCGREVDPLRARAVGIFGGLTYYFCSAEHKVEFARDPSAHLSRPAGQPPAGHGTQRGDEDLLEGGNPAIEVGPGGTPEPPPDWPEQEEGSKAAQRPSWPWILVLVALSIAAALGAAYVASHRASAPVAILESPGGRLVSRYLP